MKSLLIPKNPFLKQETLFRNQTGMSQIPLKAKESFLDQFANEHEKKKNLHCVYYLV